MGESETAQVDQLQHLTEQLDSLKKQVDELSARLTFIEADKQIVGKQPEPQQAETQQVASSIPEQKQVSRDGVLKRVGTGSLLPRVATVCFALVIALILRTITESNIINTQVGSMLGMGYAAALITTGWWLYSRKSRLAPVFPACGLLLLFSIVLETHARFESLSTVMAYIILMAAGFMVVIIGLRHRASSQLCIAALGTGLIGMAIDFPYLLFPMLAILLLAGDVAAYAASRFRMCPSLSWTTLGLTFLFWLFWAFKLTAPAVYDEPTAQLLHLGWFFPLLFLFLVFYLVTNVYKMIKDDEDLGFYESLLPTITGVGAFLAAWTVVIPWYRSTVWLGLIGILLGLGHFVVAAWLAKRHREGAIGSNTYTFAGVLLLGLGTAAMLSNILWAVPIWSVAAYFLARVSGRWKSGGVRCTSYLFQLAACLVAVSSGAMATDVAVPAASAMVAAVLVVMSILQYRWCRTHVPPGTNSAFFSWLDKNDFSAGVLLLAGILSGFFLLRLGLYQVLVRVSTDFDFMFRGGQTVFINLGAVFLLMLASRRKNVEILTVAIVVGLLGMVKSFVFDLFGIKGVPLVLSVFSSGIVAAVGSVISTRWQGKKEKGVSEPLATQSEN
jgi:hypothetical protein